MLDLSPQHEAAAAVWTQLAALARRNCEHMESKRPDLAVVLHKSGVVVWTAVEALWQATRRAPMPRVVAANIGREKGIYLYSSGAPLFEVDYLLPDAAGQFMMGTIARRPQWPSQLAAHIGAQLGDTSVREILLIDDCVHSGDTLLVASALLMEIFPRSETSLYAGLDSEWRVTLGRQWLDVCHPGLGEEMRARRDADREEFWPHRGNFDPDNIWPSLVSGLEEVENDPFATRPMTAEDCAWPYLTRYLPPEAWLEFPRWVRRQAAACVLTPTGLPDIALGRRSMYGVTRYARFFAETWRRPYFTLDEVAERSGFSAEEAGELLQQVDLIADAASGRTEYTYVQETGILDFEGLVEGHEQGLAPWVTLRRQVATPFGVEFAAVSAQYGGGPVLAALPEGQGAPVRAQLYGFHPIVSDDDGVYALLYNSILRPEAAAARAVALQGGWGLAGEIKTLRYLEGINVVYYVERPASLAFVGDAALSPAEKAERLAQLARGSLSAESYRSGRDGISYLAHVMAAGIETPLTPLYAAAVLRLAPGAQSLEEVRTALAPQNGDEDLGGAAAAAP